ncbi:MAG: type II toxin-antitoxin system prevent-host-death family antitoxin [Desulfobacterales bacterium]|nr:type II toxin-antitoxin system prevent-host-death family antitoxin [Desulfobacterales bacterium]
MEISFLDLRKKPGKIMEALERRETITLSRRGKAVAHVVPVENRRRCKTAEHPAFGMWANRLPMEKPAEMVRQMRKGRFDAL